MIPTVALCQAPGSPAFYHPVDHLLGGDPYDAALRLRQELLKVTGRRDTKVIRLVQGSIVFPEITQEITD